MSILQCEINFELGRHHGLLCASRLPRGCFSQTAATTFFILCLTCLQKPFTGQAERAFSLVRDWDAQVQRYYGLHLEKMFREVLTKCITMEVGESLSKPKHPVHNTFKPSHTELAICSTQGLSPTHKLRYQIQLFAPSYIWNRSKKVRN